jgi:adenylosuccinate synthase
MDIQQSQAIFIADLGFGDAGKGSIVDYLTRVTQAHTVVRYNGGAQAAHNVVTPDGRHHTFAQFGSGTFIPGTQTYLSRFMITHPLAMLAEERHLRSVGVEDAFERMIIDRQALVTTPFQQSANRLKEISRGRARHGSCGMGVGETMADWLAYGPDVLFAGDLHDRKQVIKKLRFLRDAKYAELETSLSDLPASDALSEELKVFDDPGIIEATADVFEYFAGLVKIVDSDYLGNITRQPGVTIFEGAQGVLLDEWYGFFPYNSWSTLTFKNAERLLSENGFDGQVLKLGLIRGYATRHGAGPFVTEDDNLTTQLQDDHNTNNPWQREFRVGYLDFVALRYALQVTGQVDGLVVTNLDRMAAMDEWQTCDSYSHPGKKPDVEEYFKLQNNLVKEIRVSADPTNLIRQEQLTRRLFEMQPVYSRCEKDSASYLERISQVLGAPIAMTSSGPTALEKTLARRVLHSGRVEPDWCLLRPYAYA